MLHLEFELLEDSSNVSSISIVVLVPSLFSTVFFSSDYDLFIHSSLFFVQINCGIRLPFWGGGIQKCFKLSFFLCSCAYQLRGKRGGERIEILKIYSLFSLMHPKVLWRIQNFSFFLGASNDFFPQIILLIFCIQLINLVSSFANLIV